jgi:GMP synthase PP-ATPase subunit
MGQGAQTRRFINQVRGIIRLGYDVTSKPPGAIAWA